MEKTQRIPALDMLRGLIMILMALDHFIYFIQRFHPAEFWITAPPIWPDPGFQVIRFLTHLCAPGFVFLAGASSVLHAHKLEAQGCQPRSIMGRQMIRSALLLFAVQFFLEGIGWMLGFLGGQGVPMNTTVTPGAPTADFLYLGVISALSFSMFLGSLVLGRKTWVPALLGAASLAISPIVLSFHSGVSDPIHPLLGVLFIPGNSFFYTAYPIFPWVGVFFFGMVLGRLLLSQGPALLKKAWIPGLISMLLGGGVRFLQPWGETQRMIPGEWTSFFDLSKYPPSQTYLLLTLGILLLILSLMQFYAESRTKLGLPLLRAFGREPLFFYLLHLYAYGGLCFLLVLPQNWLLSLMGWALSLVVFYPMLRWYHGLKGEKKLPGWLNWI